MARLTPRDLEILSALEKTPLTARQLQRLSEIFQHGAFASERRVRQRLQQLEGGSVHRARLMGAGPVDVGLAGQAGTGCPNLYYLSREGFEVLHGHDAPLPPRTVFQPIPFARQHHSHALAEFIVHTLVAAHRMRIPLKEFYRENALVLRVGRETLLPDATFTLTTEEWSDLHYLVELDNSTEPLNARSDHSWKRKIQLYDSLADAAAKRFRVLVVTTKGSRRLDAILDLVAKTARNPKRIVFIGVPLADYLRRPLPLHEACFRNHRGEFLPLISPKRNTQVNELPRELVSQPTLC